MNIQIKLIFILSMSIFLTACGDDENVDTQTVTKIAPTAVAGNDKSADATTTVSLNGNESSDPDGTIVSYEWKQTSGSYNVNIINYNQPTADFTAPNVTTNTQLTFKLTVTDNDGVTNTDTITVSIIALQENQVPVAVTAYDFSADENTSITLDGSSSYDADGTITSYSWTQTTGTLNVEINSPDSEIASFMAPDVASSTEITFNLSVTDNNGAVDTNTVTITINPIDGTPQETSGVATLSWTSPTENTDDSSLTDLAGFKVYYGDATDQLTNEVTVDSFDSYVVIEGLPNGQTCYFAVIAYMN